MPDSIEGKDWSPSYRNLGNFIFFSKFEIGLVQAGLVVKPRVNRISSAVLRGVSHEGRLIDRDACNREQEGNRDTRVIQVRAISVM